MRAWRTALAVALALALLIGAMQPSAGGAPVAAGAHDFTVGALLDLKSGWTSLGRASRVTLQLAVADANAALVRSGSPTRVRLRIIDVHGDPKASARALRRLAARDVRVVVGPEASSEVAAVRAAADSLGVVVISQGSTAHSLAIRRDAVFRFVPDDVRESEAMVALLNHDGVDAIVPVWRDDAGNAGLVTSMRKRFKGRIAQGVRYGTTVSDFRPAVEQIRAQLASLRSSGASHVAVYLAGFDEVSQLFEAAAGDSTLGAVPWYGSDGVALTPHLIATPQAAAFAAKVGYPNPILGLDDVTAKRARKLDARIRARLGHQPDAFALTSYDALQVAVAARARAGAGSSAKRFERALTRVADGYRGVTGRLSLNAAGDRAFGSFDFWSVCTSGGSATWTRTWSYVASAPGHGTIVAREHC